MLHLGFSLGYMVLHFSHSVFLLARVICSVVQVLAWLVVCSSWASSNFGLEVLLASFWIKQFVGEILGVLHH